MDPRGQYVTVMPLSTQGAVLPPGFDVTRSAVAWHERLSKQLRKAGLIERPSVNGAVLPGLGIQSRIVRIDPGKTWARFLFGLMSMLFGGAVVIEVEVQVFDQGGVFAQFSSTGRYAIAYATSGRALKVAAGMAANDVAKKSIAAMKAR